MRTFSVEIQNLLEYIDIIGKLETIPNTKTAG